MLPRFLQKKIVAVLFVCVLLIGMGFTFSVSVSQRAHAEIVGDFSGCAAGELSGLLIGFVLGLFATTVPTSPIPLVVKEGIKDCIAWAIANAVIEGITEEITKWANSGFDGNPAYVRDIKRHLQRQINDEIGGFIQETQELAFLCEPFQRQVLTALAVNFDTDGSSSYRNRASCTLDDIINNADDFQDFVDGDFSKGGWRGWIELTQRPQNNPYGSYYLAAQELGGRIGETSSAEQEQVAQGRGFLTKEACYVYEECTEYQTLEPDEFGPPACLNYETTILTTAIPLEEVPDGATCIDVQTVTPGSVIQETLQKTLGLSVDRIIQIDELNEALSTLFTKLFNEILSGDEGLRGVGVFIEENSDFTEIVEEGFPDTGSRGTLECNGGSPGSSTITRTVNRFEITQGNRSMTIGLPLDGHYPQVEIDFDFFLGPELNPDGPSNWQAIYMIVPQSPPDGVGGWFNHLTIMDRTSIMNMIGNGATENDEWTNVNASWTLNHWYHIEMVYDAGEEARIEITDKDTGNQVATMSATPANSIYNPGGGGTKLKLGSPGASTDPLVGSIIEDFTIRLEPGQAVCGGVPVGEGGGGGGGGGGEEHLP